MTAAVASAVPFSNALACARKTRYATLEQAVEVMRLRRAPWSVGRSKDPLYSYPCSLCGGFHITKLRPAGTQGVVKC